mmetsp:Transcript_61729/g.188492  ORF Transcript_61729/g.188492 Transcript_61729/m.188492 type:complete len:231 (+) Transcript_61729:321-1013(+)
MVRADAGAKPCGRQSRQRRQPPRPVWAPATSDCSRAVPHAEAFALDAPGAERRWGASAGAVRLLGAWCTGPHAGRPLRPEGVVFGVLELLDQFHDGLHRPDDQATQPEDDDDAMPRDLHVPVRDLDPVIADQLPKNEQGHERQQHADRNGADERHQHAEVRHEDCDAGTHCHQNQPHRGAVLANHGVLGRSIYHIHQDHEGGEQVEHHGRRQEEALRDFRAIPADHVVKH